MRCAVLVLVAALCLLFISAFCLEQVDASDFAESGLPSTHRWLTVQLEQLPADPDDASATPVLVSAVEETSISLKLKRGHTCSSRHEWEAGEGVGGTLDDPAGDANDITFDENFNPMWYYALRRRGFRNLEWSGCGGKWRPEWSNPTSASPAAGMMSNEDDALVESAVELAAVKHALSHHVVCSASSVSFCASARQRSPARQFQWAAQFISTLTSSPLSWRSNTPRHIRPVGTLAVAAALNDSVLAVKPDAADGRDGRPLRAPRHLPGVVKTDRLVELEEETQNWCSYHVVNHDTLCTQHISPVLNGGRSGSGVQDGLPPGLFKAVVPSLPLLFSTPFHQFRFRGRQMCTGNNSVELTMTLRMSFVVRSDEDVSAVASHLSHELPALRATAKKAHNNRLRVVVGPNGVPPELQSALASLEHTPTLQNLSQAHVRGSQDRTAASPEQSHKQVSSTVAGLSYGLPWAPEVRYKVAMSGKDHGFYTLEIVPTSALSAALNLPHRVGGRRQSSTPTPPAVAANSTSAASAAMLRAGDVVRSLVLIPLHLLRPALYSMESLHGTTVLEKTHVDTSANTIAMVLRTTLTEAHLAAYDTAYLESQQADAAFHDVPGMLLVRFPLDYGWAGSRDAPRDAESFRPVPQPVVSITRCRDANTLAASRGTLDHSEAISVIMNLLPSTRPGTSEAELDDSTACPVMWLRSTMVSGTYIPAPDPAMLFNAFALGLVGFTLGIGALARGSHILFGREEDRQELIDPAYDAELEWRHGLRQQRQAA